MQFIQLRPLLQHVLDPPNLKVIRSAVLSSRRMKKTILCGNPIHNWGKKNRNQKKLQFMGYQWGIFRAILAFFLRNISSIQQKENFQGVDAGNGYHPYTTPSLYAYLQLLIFLNALACLTVWSEKLEQEFDNMKDVRFGNLPHFWNYKPKKQKIVLEIWIGNVWKWDSRSIWILGSLYESARK